MTKNSMTKGVSLVKAFPIVRAIVRDGEAVEVKRHQVTFDGCAWVRRVVSRLGSDAAANKKLLYQELRYHSRYRWLKVQALEVAAVDFPGVGDACRWAREDMRKGGVLTFGQRAGQRVNECPPDYLMNQLAYDRLFPEYVEAISRTVEGWYEDPSEMPFPVGKFRGLPTRLVPTWHLRWQLGRSYLGEATRLILEREMELRSTGEYEGCWANAHHWAFHQWDVSFDRPLTGGFSPWSGMEGRKPGGWFVSNPTSYMDGWVGQPQRPQAVLDLVRLVGRRKAEELVGEEPLAGNWLRLQPVWVLKERHQTYRTLRSRVGGRWCVRASARKYNWKPSKTAKIPFGPRKGQPKWEPLPGSIPAKKVVETYEDFLERLDWIEGARDLVDLDCYKVQADRLMDALVKEEEWFEDNKLRLHLEEVYRERKEAIERGEETRCMRGHSAAPEEGDDDYVEKSRRGVRRRGGLSADDAHAQRVHHYGRLLQGCRSEGDLLDVAAMIARHKKEFTPQGLAQLRAVYKEVKAEMVTPETVKALIVHVADEKAPAVK